MAAVGRFPGRFECWWCKPLHGCPKRASEALCGASCSGLSAGYVFEYGKSPAHEWEGLVCCICRARPGDSGLFRSFSPVCSGWGGSRWGVGRLPCCHWLYPGAFSPLGLRIIGQQPIQLLECIAVVPESLPLILETAFCVIRKLPKEHMEHFRPL